MATSPATATVAPRRSGAKPRQADKCRLDHHGPAHAVTTRATAATPTSSAAPTTIQGRPTLSIRTAPPPAPNRIAAITAAAANPTTPAEGLSRCPATMTATSIAVAPAAAHRARAARSEDPARLATAGGPRGAPRGPLHQATTAPRSR